MSTLGHSGQSATVEWWAWGTRRSGFPVTMAIMDTGITVIPVAETPWAAVGPQQTWQSAFAETRFSGDLFRSPIIPLCAFGMIFFSVVLVICLADNNLLISLSVSTMKRSKNARLKFRLSSRRRKS